MTWPSRSQPSEPSPLTLWPLTLWPLTLWPLTLAVCSCGWVVDRRMRGIQTCPRCRNTEPLPSVKETKLGACQQSGAAQHSIFYF